MSALITQDCPGCPEQYAVIPGEPATCPRCSLTVTVAGDEYVRFRESRGAPSNTARSIHEHHGSGDREAIGVNLRRVPTRYAYPAGGRR